MGGGGKGKELKELAGLKLINAGCPPPPNKKF